MEIEGFYIPLVLTLIMFFLAWLTSDDDVPDTQASLISSSLYILCFNTAICLLRASISKSKSFVYPLNTFGEPMSIPPGQTVPMGYRKHCKVAKKHFIAGAKWNQEQSNENALDFEIDALKRQIAVLKHNMYSEEDMREAYSSGWTTRERFDDLSPDIIYPKGLDYEEKQDYSFNLWFEQFKKK